MRIAYFDCSAGISGDMFLGALIDAGLPIQALEAAAADLGLKDLSLSTARVQRAGLGAASFKVEAKEGKRARPWKDIRNMLSKSSLKPRVKEMALAIFSALAKAEGLVHDQAPATVHFHELGALDSIMDIVGAAVGLDHFGIETSFSSPVKVGGGWIESEHGRLPSPAPATLELLRGVPIYGGKEALELTTPTGAAILKAIVGEFGPIPALRATSIGYGAGSYDLPSPNIFRLIIGETELPSCEDDELLLLETNIDDLEPKLFGHIVERLFAAGALDAWLAPIYMKKMRPAVTLSALAGKDKKDDLIEAFFLETGSLGVRVSPIARRKATRSFVCAKTIYGKILVKVGRIEGKVMSVSPEYEDCRAAALRAAVPIKNVYEEARMAVLQDLGKA